MSRADYAHLNEDADRVWWEEEGKHGNEEPYDPDDFLSADDTRAVFEDVRDVIRAEPPTQHAVTSKVFHGLSGFESSNHHNHPHQHITVEWGDENGNWWKATLTVSDVEPLEDD